MNDSKSSTTKSHKKIVPVVVKLSDADKLKVRAAYNQLYWEHGQLPTAETVYEFLDHNYPLVRLQELAADPDFKAALERQGLLSEGISEKALSTEQILVANMELNFFDTRSIRQKLDEVKNATGVEISTSRYAAWKRDPAYQAYITRRVEVLFADIDTEAYKQLYRGVVAGDMKAIEMAMTMKGKYAKNVNVNLNVDQVLLRVIEIISKHVREPQILEAIAHDFEGLKELTMGNVNA